MHACRGHVGGSGSGLGLTSAWHFSGGSELYGPLDHAPACRSWMSRATSSQSSEAKSSQVKRACCLPCLFEFDCATAVSKTQTHCMHTPRGGVW